MPDGRRGAPALLAAGVDRFGATRRSALRARLATLLEVLGAPAAEVPTRTLVDGLERALAVPTASTVWLTLAVLRAELPDTARVQRVLRAARLDGAAAALLRELPLTPSDRPWEGGGWAPVEVVTGEVLVDLHHTSDTTLATGIQRVSRQSGQRWVRDHDVRLVRWSPRYTALWELDPAERERALHGAPARPHSASGRAVVVPWGCTYLLPELVTEPDRARALEAAVSFSASRTGMIGFDCVPITSAETTADGMGGGFASMLSAAGRMDRIAAISDAAAIEYGGWRTMLSGAGLPGPDVRAVALAVEGSTATPDALEQARSTLTVAGLPMVLVVGSHEPRKNHLAVLHAAELLWREGRQFSLLFVGGNAWRSERFAQRLHELMAGGRPVESRSGLPDELLWAAYEVADVVLFPSFNEGFGLPVAEALASGTPVITSGYGSMAEIAQSGGALFVDPRDDADIADALRRLLTDRELHGVLSAQARERASRTWDAYAAEVWDYLVDAVAP